MTTQLKKQPTKTQVAEAPLQAPEHTAPAKRKMRRTGRWIVALAMAATVGIVAINATTDEPAVTAPAYQGTDVYPDGGNSSVLPATDAADDLGPFDSKFDSPGGNSLNIPTKPTQQDVPAFDSPGGHSLNIR